MRAPGHDRPSRQSWSPGFRTRIRTLLEAPGRIEPEARVVLGAVQRADELMADILVQVLSRRPDPDSASSTGLKQLLVLPVGDQCNLACRYCYEAGRRQEESPRKMPMETFRAVVDHVLPHVTPPFSLALHGGEPLLAGKAFFREAVEAVRGSPIGDEVEIIVQTNATLLDEEWCELMGELGITVGLSLDGPPEVHDEVRVDRRGRGTHRRVLEGIAALRSAGLEFGVIVVVNRLQAERPDAADRLYEHLRELGITRFDVHPAFSHAPDTRSLNLEPVPYARFMEALFDRWLREGDPGVRITFFDNFYEAMGGQKARACYLSGSCTTILGVDAWGRAIPCTRPFGSEHVFGNLAVQPLPAVMDGRPFTRFKSQEAHGQKATEPCSWNQHCFGGCPHERGKAGEREVAGRNVYCTCDEGGRGGYPAIFEHMKARSEEVLARAAG